MDNFEIEIIFQNISYLINNRINRLSENSKFYLDQSMIFFNNLVKSLDSLESTTQGNNNQNDSYIFFPRLQEVVLSAPNTSHKISEKELVLIKKYFLSVIGDIEKLKSNPDRFYSTEKSEQLKDLADKLAIIHSEDFYSHTFETEETFNNSYSLC